MKVRVFYPNKDNKIEFTKQQLEKLLDTTTTSGYVTALNSISIGDEK